MSGLNEIRVRKVPIVLDKERALAYDLNAYAELEEMYGSIEATMEALQTGKVAHIRNILWAGLIHEEMDEDFNIKISKVAVGRLLSLDSIDIVVEKIVEAITGSMPDEDTVEQVAQQGN